ncbi:stress response protein nst1-like [Galendromus occidentalis]|uniref:Stress response protein nst1-like n=1 Tax=Galendromus occidentalis TaxID=34638 RepID=A0AAJ7SHL1_9ACAR|nr:stress response protein nst1-like [Galendromus occidentalis]
MASVRAKEVKSEGDRLAEELESLTLEDDEGIQQTKDGVSMKNMHFTNGDWFPKEKPKPAKIPEGAADVASGADGEVQGKGAPDGCGVDFGSDTEESQKEDEEDADEDDLLKYKDEETGEVPQSFFDVLCRECSKIPYTPEENQERRNKGHKERNQMLLDGIKTNHREWFYQIEEKLALEMMNQKRKALKKARKEEQTLNAA